MKTLILLIALLTPQFLMMGQDSFLYHIEACDLIDTCPVVDDRWQVVFPSLMIDWSIVADEIRNRNLF